MKSQLVQISFETYRSDYPHDPNALIHRIRNLGEGIYYEIRGKRLAKLLNLDTATESLDLIVPSAGKLRQVNRIIRKCLAEHNFGDATVRVYDKVGES